MGIPNFIVLGAGKSGTTSLYRYLNEHPQIFLPKLKELYFFLHPDDHNPVGLTDWDAYQALYANAQPDQVKGEVSSVYLFRESAAAYIQQYCPKTKLIAILRNPIDRAFSDYLYNLKGLHPSVLNDRQRPRPFDDFIHPNQYFIRIGYYTQQLQRYYARFPAEQIRIYLFDDLSQDSATLIRDLYEFIEVDPDFHPDTSKKYNVSGVPKQVGVYRILKQDNPIRRAGALLLKPFLSSEARQNLRSRLLKQSLKKPTLSAAHRQQLLAIYRDEIRQLQDLIQRDLSDWQR